jgi:BioD-like phosphotransacetylase family protein
MSADAALRLPVFKKENKLVITGGDRSDMILAALETNSVGVVLTNNVTPPPNILSKASDLNIPILLVSDDTFQAAKHVDDMEALLVKDDIQKINLLEQMIKKHIKLDDLVSL